MGEHEHRLVAGESRLHVVADPEPLHEEGIEPESEDIPARRPPARRRRRWVVLVALGIVAALTVTSAVTDRWPFGSSSDQNLKIIGALPYWSTAKNTTKILEHKSDFTAVSPWMYGIDAGRGVVSLLPPAQVGRTTAALDALRRSNVELMPTISNIRDGSWDYPTIIAILRDPARRARHIADIVHLVRIKNYAGVDIDYENFKTGDRQVFTAFVSELATALHKDHKTLSVDLFAKTSDRGYDQRNQAQDYRALGRAADTVRLMAYDWHWISSDPGPIAPINWVHSVLDYALTQIPAKKVVLGVPAYGYDWVGNHGRLVSWLQVYGLEQKYGAAVHWDQTAQSPWLTYRSSDGQRHVVWFENAYSALAKLAVARSMHIGGAYLWLAGDEDDLLWNRLSPKEIDKAVRDGEAHPAGAPS